MHSLRILAFHANLSYWLLDYRQEVSPGGILQGGSLLARPDHLSKGKCTPTGCTQIYLCLLKYFISNTIVPLLCFCEGLVTT
jgi:hypothetical protein